MTEPLAFAFYLSSVPFTRDVLTWRASLGGSESACLVTMRALAQRGHRVHAFAEQLAPDLAGWTDDAGVQWYPAARLGDAFTFKRFDVFVSLRMHGVFLLKSSAKLNLLWGQDMLLEPIAGSLSQVDGLVYVSDWQRRQWAAVDDVLPRIPSFLTPNAIDPDHFAGLPAYRAPNLKAPRFIHTSRPERGLDALLTLWPKIRASWPEAQLALCRYSSMYDAQGWGKVCAAFDAKVASVDAAVGGMTWLGELNKTALYRALSESDLLLYPTSQRGFGETNCVACTEAQMVGTPFLGSHRGALPETLHPDAGRLLEQPSEDAWTDPAWQDRWVETMAEMLDPLTHRRMAKAGRAKAAEAFGPIVAIHWEEQILELFRTRHARYGPQIIRRFLNDDNHVLARQALDACPDYPDHAATVAFCDRVIAGDDQTAEDYGERAVQDGKAEAQMSERMRLASEKLCGMLTAETPTILDYACGNGAMALRIVTDHATARVDGVDYSERVLDLASVTCADVPDRVTFQPSSALADPSASYDGAFCGEFLEHVAEPWAVISTIESHVKDGAPIVFTMPSGPWTELMPFGVPVKRGHLWMYDERDLTALFGHKREASWVYYRVGNSTKDSAIGFWLVSYRCDHARPSVPFTPEYLTRALLTERPYTTIHASMIMRNEEATIIRCLHSLRAVVDKIVIYDTGSHDSSIELAEQHGATVIRGTWTEDFQAARNASLDAASVGADVVLWIDADEWLSDPGRLRDTILLQAPFRGWALKQFHLQSDKPNFYDKPVRAFRTGEGVRFWGVVHEQPGDTLNGAVLPALMVESPIILHTGYVTPQQRLAKMLHRNLALLLREVKGQGPHPPRDLAWVLLMRDFVNLTMIEGMDGDRLNDAGTTWIAQALGVYRKRFAALDAPLHELAWDFYQQALDLSHTGTEVKWGFAAGASAKTARITPEVFRALTTDEARRMIAHRVDGWLTRLDPKTFTVPPPLDSAAVVRLVPVPVEA